MNVFLLLILPIKKCLGPFQGPKRSQPSEPSSTPPPPPHTPYHHHQSRTHQRLNHPNGHNPHINQSLNFAVTFSQPPPIRNPLRIGLADPFHSDQPTRFNTIALVISQPCHQFDQVRDILKQIEGVADRLTKQGDAQALHDFYLELTQTHNYFEEYADQQEAAILALDDDDDNKKATKDENDELSFDLDEVDVPAKVEPTKVATAVPAPVIAKPLTKQQQQEQLQQQQQEQELTAQLKQFKDIELYIGDKFTQYGCTFEQDLFTPNDPLKIGLIHIQALLLIFRKLGVYLSPTESSLLLNKFKPTQAQIDDYVRTHVVQKDNLPIEKHFVNYSLFFLYLQALNNVALTSRAVIVSNVPALMAGRALQFQPSNPHPQDPLKENAKIQGLVPEKDINRQAAAFNEPMAQVTLVSEHANKPKDYVVNLVVVQKLIRDFASKHPSPSRIYSAMKRSTSHTENVTKYGENTMTIDALIIGLKANNFKLSELPCSVDVFKQYVGLYSESGIPAIKFTEFVSFINCEEPKKGWSALLVPTQVPVGEQPNGLMPLFNTKNHVEKPIVQAEQGFVEIITAIVKDRGFAHAVITISSSDPRQLFRHLARGDNVISVETIVSYLIESRCPEHLVNNDNFKKFVSMYSTTRDNYLNYNDFIIFKECKQNYLDILHGDFTKTTTIQDDTPLYASFAAISAHFTTTNPHLSFHYCAQTILSKETNAAAPQSLSQVQFYNTLYTAQVNISYDQTLFLFDALNARVAQSGQPTEDVVFLHPTDPARQIDEGKSGQMLVPLVYLPLSVVNAIIQNPLVYPLIQKAYTAETGQEVINKGATVKRTTNSNAASLNDDNDLVKLMEQLCLSPEDSRPKPKANPRFQSSLIQDMTDDQYNSHANHDLQQGTRKHFADHVQSRKQLRTSIGFGNRSTTPNSNAITTEDAELVHRERISNKQARLTIDFDNDHGGRTPLKSRENLYPHAAQTYSLTSAAGEDHPVQFGLKSTRHTQTTFDEIDDYQSTISARPQNSRSFTSSVLKLRNTPMRSHPARQTLAPDTTVLLGVQPDVAFTPQKPISGQRFRPYPNRNQTAVQMQHETPGNDDKVSRYQRAPYDPSVSRQAMGHLNDGFQPADTPFLLRRQGRFAKLTQKDQVIQDDFERNQAYEQAADQVNPRDKNRRRTGYHNPNNVVDLMNLEISHPVYQTDSKLVNDIDNALLKHTDLAQYIIDNTNRSYKDLASRQLISVQQPPPQVEPAPSTPVLVSKAVAQQQEDDEFKDIVDTIFVLDEPEQQQSQQPPQQIEQGQQPPQEQLQPGQLSAEQLQDLNVQVTNLSGRLGKSREVFAKWAEFTGALTGELLHKALTKNDFNITLPNAQQLIDSVNQEPGGSLNLSGFSRLLGRGAV